MGRINFILTCDKHENNFITSGPGYSKPSSEVINLFFMKDILIAHESELTKTKKMSCFETLRCCIYPAKKCKNANNCWHFNIHVQDKLFAKLS